MPSAAVRSSRPCESVHKKCWILFYFDRNALVFFVKAHRLEGVLAEVHTSHTLRAEADRLTLAQSIGWILIRVCFPRLSQAADGGTRGASSRCARCACARCLAARTILVSLDHEKRHYDRRKQYDGYDECSSIHSAYDTRTRAHTHAHQQSISRASSSVIRHPPSLDSANY